MKKSIFDYDNYKLYLRDLIRSTPQYGHGFKSKIAKALGCQTAYLSQVLNKDANFSLEQAEDLNQFLQHTYEESQFFLLLVQKSRSGSARLSQRLLQQINEIHARRESLKERLEKSDSLSLENQTRYYSRWYYAGIHILCTIAKFQTKETIATALNLSLGTVGEVLEFLTQVGLVKFEGGRYVPGLPRLFLPSDSPMIIQLHTNWRLKTLESLSQDKKTDLHYSTCVSLSRNDLRIIKDKLIAAINEARAIIKDSKEEELCCFVIDFYSLLRES